MVNLQPINNSWNGGINAPLPTHIASVNVTFNITVLVGFITLFTSVAALGILSGMDIAIFGSNFRIGERSQKVLYNLLFYGGLWGIFTTLATTGLNGIGLFSLPYFTGHIFFLILSLLYVLGINQQIEGTA